MKRILTVMMMAVEMAAFAATPTISNVKAQQRYPWNGLVDIDYTITGDTTGLNLSFSVRDGQNDKTYTPATFLAQPSAAEGTHRVTWSPKGDGLNIISTNIVVTVLLTRTVVPPAQNGEYLVIDLSGGPTATSYPVSSLDSVPSGGWTTEYKTTKLVLRKLTGGTFDMGGSVSTTITQPFYIGVFEVTQKQYELVTGSNPCSATSYGKGDDYPVHNVSYNDIRGSSNGAGWPASSAVDGDSFLGKIQARTGLALDLPTEAQWEYACRAGTTTTYSYGNSADGRYMWYVDNSSSTSHTVGTKLPNPWGLYDMHGNVWEWTLDWWQLSLTGGNDPKGATSGSARVRRGGSWSHDAGSCASSYRGIYIGPSCRGYDYGFRLCCSAGL
ncbi:MAG: formylglycine-generating enzyme family protein [Kiritimatiellae bacterium]|nr:formylglycine-generating enzyme family protein [Kiritimatiellia bacterium]